MALVLVALAFVIAALYQFFGLRFVMDGGGTPYPRFVQTNEGQAERIERHREAQRAAVAAAPCGRRRTAASRQSSRWSHLVRRSPLRHRRPTPRRRVDRHRMDGLPRTERDGEYREVRLPIGRTSGLMPLWKQPVGGGYASFVVAGSRIHDRAARSAEVAAHDVPTGREPGRTRGPLNSGS